MAFHVHWKAKPACFPVPQLLGAVLPVKPIYCIGFQTRQTENWDSYLRIKRNRLLTAVQGYVELLSQLSLIL